MPRVKFNWASSYIGKTLQRSLILLALVFMTLARADSAAAQRAPTPDPKNFHAQYTLAVSYLEKGDVKAAIPYLRRAYAIDPAHYDNGYNFAVALLQIGRVEEARAVVTPLLKVNETGELRNLLGDVEEAAGNLKEAADHFQRAAHMNATEEHLFDWGNIYLRLRAGDNALEVFTVAVVRFPKSARLQIGLGIAQYSRGQYSEAVASFCRAVDLDPSDPRPYDFLGEIYGVAPELAPEVTARLAGFVKAHPRHAMAHLYYALSVWRGERARSEPAVLQQVETLLKRAIALDPKLARAFLELGILLSDQERYAEAVEQLRRATVLQPGVAQAHYRLAQAYRRTGQAALAEKELETFQQLKGDAP
ncbi:MAG TPA: tetratricopeptide repeat protein [Vicinamibacterales bacterium]|nr:tetratricopeptide repeat protein [Vicinamibacterales bacterium]